MCLNSGIVSVLTCCVSLSLVWLLSSCSAGLNLTYHRTWDCVCPELVLSEHTQHAHRRKALYIHSSSVQEVGAWSVAYLPSLRRTQVHHGACGQSEEVPEEAHQEADQLCVGGEEAEDVRQTQELEAVERSGRQRKEQEVWESSSTANCTP